MEREKIKVAINKIAEYLNEENVDKEWVDVLNIAKKAMEKQASEIKVVFVKHKHGKNYLFETEENLKKGDEVRCDTRYGEEDGVCATDSFDISYNAMFHMAKELNAPLPLRKVIGKYEVEVVKIKELKKFGCLPF